MLKLHCSAVLSAIVALSLASCALAEDAVVADSASLNAAWNRAKPGDRILMAPGVYTGSVALSGGGGTLDRPIIIAAQDPLNPPVFDLGKKAINTFKASCFMLDGIVLKSTAVNAIQVIFGHHVVLKNFKAVDSGVGTGNSAVKFTGCNNFLMYNVTVTRWGLCGVDMVGDAKGLLMNNHLSNSTKPPHNACAFQAKGGSFDIGIFDNVVKDAGVRAIMMGGSTGAPFFHQGNIAKGWECYDSVAMGNKIVGGLWPISYSDANNIHFDYNTVVGPANGLLRILAESQPAPNPSSNGHYSHNLVQYGNVAECVNTSPNNVKPETFTFDGNYWFRTTNPAASKPRLPGKQINDAGEADPQLDASFNPQYEPAKAYRRRCPGQGRRLAAARQQVPVGLGRGRELSAPCPSRRDPLRQRRDLRREQFHFGREFLRQQHTEVLRLGPGQRRQRRSDRHRTRATDLRGTRRHLWQQEGRPYHWAEGVGHRRIGPRGLVQDGARRRHRTVAAPANAATPLFPTRQLFAALADGFVALGSGHLVDGVPKGRVGRRPDAIARRLMAALAVA